MDEIIEKYDSMYRNEVDYDRKLEWIERLEEQLKDKIAEQYEGTEGRVGVYPYDEIYYDYIGMKIAEMNGDNFRYNNYKSLFDAAYADLADYYNRKYQLKRGTRYNAYPLS